MSARFYFVPRVALVLAPLAFRLGLDHKLCSRCCSDIWNRMAHGCDKDGGSLTGLGVDCVARGCDFPSASRLP